MVERPAEKDIVRVEGAVHAPSYSRVEKTAQLLEQAGRSRPAYIIHVACNDTGSSVLFCLFSYHYQLCITRQRCFAFIRRRRAGMDTVKADPLTGFQLNLGVNRRDIILHQVLHFGIDQLQPAV